MWFKNLFVYRLPAEFQLTAAKLSEQLATRPLQPCSGLEKNSKGWVASNPAGDLVHVMQGQMLIALGVEQKLLPASVVNQLAKERIADIEAQQGYKLGRKQVKDLKEQLTEELLPRAFVNRRLTYAWIDNKHGWLVVDAASSAKAEELLELLSKTLQELPVKLLHTELSPMAAMTDWLAGSAAPSGFSIDRELELRATGESKATVRYANHALEGEEILRHIAAGKRATRLGMTWNDRISFVLNEQLQVKRLSFLDVIKEESSNQADHADEVFDVEFAMMTGELAKLLQDLVDALGGEVVNKI